MSKKKLLSVFAILYSFVAMSQEIQFSQFFSSSLYLNPAFSAIYVEPSLFVNYRRPLDNGLNYNETSQISLSVPVLINKAENLPRGGVGIMAYNNQSGYEGIFKISGAFLNYGHNFSIGRLNTEVIAVGVQVGMESYRVNFSDLRWGSSYNPYYGYDDSMATPVTEFDDETTHAIVNAGVMYYYNRQRNFTLYNYSAFSGFAITNINRPQKSFVKDGSSKAPLLYKYHGGFEFKVRKFNILPNILIQYQTRNYTADGGIYTWYSFHENNFGTGHDIKLVAGAWYRLRDSFIFLAGLNYNSFSVKASYDLNSNLFYDDEVEYSRNHFELSLQYVLRKESRVRKISNPLF
ncbi:MAG: hypothetical protein CMB80_08255 [Flammeovirgaceae bacterium]|nr:hypothetical protein [Flammeovirgaceae bacterium]MBR07812.1 hypothetical protein [Rickettsiales bacterium]HCX22785.1 hypothetical protein [Cytophagales bacterium]|tara:strand:- start:4938 stop:5981 length:1044 start_codon:yes stop_codon:yes gene_type:complete